MSPNWQDYKNWLGTSLLSTAPENRSAPGIADWGTDSRAIKKNTWFVPIKGENFDGHDFINKAMEAGAAGFLFEKNAAGKVDRKFLTAGLMVTDTLAAYQQIASGWRSTLKKTRIAAITGSVGKTTTKEMIACIFQNAGSCFSTAASFNNEIGVPISLLRIKPDDSYAILEFGARRVGNIAFLCNVAKPDITILLNVGVAHLGIFGSLENLRNTKLEIFRNSPAHSILVANYDDPEILKGAKNTGKSVISFGSGAGADVCISSCKIRPESGITELEISFRGKMYRFDLKSCHSGFATNAVAALATAVAAEISMEIAIEGLQRFEPVAGRFKVMPGENLTAIDDTYNANPESMKSGLASVFGQFPGKKINLLLGDMLELGNDSPKMHEDIGSYLKQYPVNRLATVGTEAHLFHKGFSSDRSKGGKTLSFSTVKDAIDNLNAILDGADVLFVKGSNGIRLAQFLSHLQTSGILK